MDISMVNEVAKAAEPTATESVFSQQGIGKDGFLKLLITQMQNQDPLEPMSNEDFAAQLAQFSSLEQMQNMNNNFNKLTSLTEMGSAAGLIGKEVNFFSEELGHENGVVDRVVLKADGLYLSINGKEINAADVTDIGLPAATAPTKSNTGETL